MLGASALPKRWRSGDSDKPAEKPDWYKKFIAPPLQALSGKACTHPIHSIVSVLLIASTVYLGLLDTNLFDRSSNGGAIDAADFSTLVEGSKHLFADDKTHWKWITEDARRDEGEDTAAQALALITLEFPASIGSAPRAKSILPSSEFVQILPNSPNTVSELSGDTTLAFSLPVASAPEFLSAIQEIRAPKSAREPLESEHGQEEKKWIMTAARPAQSSRSIRARITSAWGSFLDLLKNAESLDITIMALGYLSMHLTFVSLFLSMRRLGSNFWLATTVLFESGFAFLLGLLVTTKLGVDINMILLSEGLPFLVVTIGFEKPIILTKAVLSASMDARRKASAKEGEKLPPHTIHSAIKTAVQERGFEIIRDYFIEICILGAGAASGVQGGLRPFCFLAAWILFFDCILLFTFYTSILSIKLEINRIKRHVELRKALEADGVSRSVAENVAYSNDGFPESANLGIGEISIFGAKVKDSSVPKFKAFMVSGFLIINIINIITIPFRGSGSGTAIPGFSSVAQPFMDPFKVARNGLDALLTNAQSQNLSTAVTILTPIKYELQYPSEYYAQSNGSTSMFPPELSEPVYGVGGIALGGILRSLEDPVLGKWIIAVLAISIVLNGYLFNAARMTIKEPHTPLDPPRNEEMQDGAITPRTSVASPRSHAPVGNGHAIATRPDLTMTEVKPEHRAPPTPAATPSPSDGKQAEPVDANRRSNKLPKRSYEECLQILKAKKAPEMNDEELIELSLKGKIPGYALEKVLVDKTRAVKVRRAVVSRTHATRETSTLLESSLLPYEGYNYDRVHGACCENVIGYLPLPIGVAGPLLIDGQNYFLPMATTEGVLVASTSRGAKAINYGGGAITVLTGDGMTRGPCVGFETLARAGQAKVWLDSDEGQRTMKNAFNSTSSFARLQSMTTALAGTYCYIRFKTTTGDAMGMNMISKGCEKALATMSSECGFSDMNIISLSGNYCTDKKPAAINWVNGRGKSVVAEAIIPANVVEDVLKCSVDSMVELNTSKNLIGSAMAGSIGGFNAHAANIVTAIFLATGQDPAQNVESSNCITVMKNYHGNLQISVSMPSIEVGTIGGGTILEPQSAMLDLLGVRGANHGSPGDNARQLAKIVAASVLAGELSLCGALAAGHLVRAHMSHNRSAVPSRAATPAPPAGTQTPTTTAINTLKDAASGSNSVAPPR